MAKLDLVGVPEIAEMLQVHRRTVWRYLESPDFPEVVAEVRRKRLWERQAVKEWAGSHLPSPYDPRSKGPPQ
jgi:predicted DNA-binding transcriptional regulator AlpA